MGTVRKSETSVGFCETVVQYPTIHHNYYLFQELARLFLFLWLTGKEFGKCQLILMDRAITIFEHLLSVTRNQKFMCLRRQAINTPLIRGDRDWAITLMMEAISTSETSSVLRNYMAQYPERQSSSHSLPGYSTQTAGY